jgi:hypothetical protein
VPEDLYHFGKDFGLVHELDVAMHQNLVPAQFGRDALYQHALCVGSVESCVYRAFGGLRQFLKGLVFIQHPILFIILLLTKDHQMQFVFVLYF